MVKYKIGYTQGTFDMFHIGHLNLLRQAKEQCEKLIVGINSDQLVQEYKSKTPVVNEHDRMDIVKEIRCVDEVLLCGGVAANKKLREMLRQMCEEHYVDFYMPPMKYCGDNGSMIARLGLLSYNENPEHNIELPNNIRHKGAEADIIETKWDNKEAIVKNRVSKNYRTKELDDKLRLERTKEESKLIYEAKKYNVNTPFIYSVDLENFNIIMEKVDAIQLQEKIETSNVSELKELVNKIGSMVRNMHDGEIIHGDLTPANILIKDEQPILIDFGLGKYSNLLEDKGTDLLVFKKSLKTIIPEESDKLFEWFLEAYDNSEIVKKIDEIEKRGRYL